MNQIAQRISPAEAFKLIQLNQDLTIVDLRRPEEIVGGRIEKSIALDFDAGVFSRRVDALPRERTYLIYCHSSVRSAKALAIMRSLGFQSVYEIGGGMEAWTAAGLPIVV